MLEIIQKNTNLDFSDRVPVGYWTLLSHQEVRETDRARSGAGQNGAGQNWTGQKWSRPDSDLPSEGAWSNGALLSLTTW